MTSLLTCAALALALVQAPASPSLTSQREVLRSVVAITTLPAADLQAIPAAKEVEHDSEVARSEKVTVVVMIQGCRPDATGACRAEADLVVYRPDGSVHSETKGVALTGGRGTMPLELTAADATGVYRVVATVRDLGATRFGKTERLFGVK